MTDRQQEALLRTLVAAQRQADASAGQFAVLHQQSLATREMLGAAIALVRSDAVDPRQAPAFATFDDNVDATDVSSAVFRELRTIAGKSGDPVLQRFVQALPAEAAAPGTPTGAKRSRKREPATMLDTVAGYPRGVKPSVAPSPTTKRAKARRR